MNPLYRACVTLSLLPLILALPAIAADCTAVNYACQMDPAVSEAGRATVLLKIPGVGQCTGLLVNNARGDGKPYILTARHCAGGSTEASESPQVRAQGIEIYYRYEAACADGAVTWAAMQTGATHRASHGDAWLIEGNAPIPSGFGAWLAGIDLREPQSTAAFGVHHAALLPKAYVDSELIGASQTYLAYDSVQMPVVTWQTRLLGGSVDIGASGSGLFDASGRALGLLSLGTACAGDGAALHYQQLGDAWTGGGTAATSLSAWLDPDALGVVRMDGADADPLPLQPHAPEVLILKSETAGDASGGGGAMPPVALFLLLALLLLRRRG